MNGMRDSTRAHVAVQYMSIHNPGKGYHHFPFAGFTFVTKDCTEIVRSAHLLPTEAQENRVRERLISSIRTLTSNRSYTMPVQVRMEL